MRIVIFILCLFSLPSLAQISQGGNPYSFDSPLIEEIERITFPEVNVQELLKEDSIESLRNRPMRFGKAHEVKISSTNSGSWEIVNEEVKVWRLALSCPNAFSVNLVYNKFHIPEGGKLFIYNEDKSYLLGAFTSKNNSDENPEFSTGLIPGETLILEYNAPLSGSDLQIEISRVVHGYKNFFNFGDSGPCNNNVNCPEGLGWTDQTNSVAMIVLSGGTRWCSGAMINNACEDATPYFLTANHCLTGAGVSNWMFYFNYQSPTCANIDGPTNQIVSGASLIATSAASDFALLELDNRPPASYNTYYSGWSNINTPADTSIAIHHPSGDIKKISFSYQSTESTDYLASSIDSTKTHWRVPSWDDGTTEGGSSGSPLFNTNKQIIGQLHGGFASCTSITSDWYGKLSYSWHEAGSDNSVLSVWLNPSQNNVDTLSGNYFPVIPSLDASFSQISSPIQNSCLRIQIPELSFKNKGQDTISSVNIAWEIAGVINDTLSWTGQLLPLQEINVKLDTLTFNYGTHNLIAEILTVNGQVDNNSCNNLKSKTFTVTQGNEVEFNIRSDNWPEEIRLEIADTSGNVIRNLSGFTANTLESFAFCLAPGCYDFTVFDSWGDGLTGSGFFNIEYKDSIHFSASGAFGNCTGSQMPGGCSVTYRLCMDSSLFLQLPSAAYQTSDTLYKTGDTIQITDLSGNFPDSWDWTLTTDSTSYNLNTRNIELIAQFEGWYDIKLKVSNIFGEDSIVGIKAFRVEKEVGLSNDFTRKEIKIYPNPAKHVLNINSELNENLEVLIISLEGKVMRNLVSDEVNFDIDISDLPPGLYLIQLSSKSHLQTTKIMIQ